MPNRPRRADERLNEIEPRAIIEAFSARALTPDPRSQHRATCGAHPQSRKRPTTKGTMMAKSLLSNRSCCGGPTLVARNENIPRKTLGTAANGLIWHIIIYIGVLSQRPPVDPRAGSEFCNGAFWPALPEHARRRQRGGTLPAPAHGQREHGADRHRGRASLSRARFCNRPWPIG